MMMMSNYSNVIIVVLYVIIMTEWSCGLLWLAKPRLYWLSRHMSVWSAVSFNFAILINLIVALFYPFESKTAGMYVYS